VSRTSNAPPHRTKKGQNTKEDSEAFFPIVFDLILPANRQIRDIRIPKRSVLSFPATRLPATPTIRRAATSTPAHSFRTLKDLRRELRIAISRIENTQSSTHSRSTDHQVCTRQPLAPHDPRSPLYVRSWRSTPRPKYPRSADALVLAVPKQTPGPLQYRTAPLDRLQLNPPSPG